MTEKLLVFTDIHIRREGENIIGLDPLMQLRAGIEHALAHHPDAKRMVLMGDLTHHGHPEEYARLSEALADVPIPVSLMIGNHDRRDAFQTAFPAAPQIESGHVQHFVDMGNTRLIMLDTLDGPPHLADQHAGHLCAERLAWLEAALEGAQGRRVLVFTHHPPVAVGFPGMDKIRLANENDLLTRLARFPNVVHLFAGHVHRTISGNIGGLAFTIFKSPCHQMPMLLGVEGSAHSVAEPGAYGIVLLNADSVIVHSEDFGLDQLPVFDGHEAAALTPA